MRRSLLNNRSPASGLFARDRVASSLDGTRSGGSFLDVSPFPNATIPSAEALIAQVASLELCNLRRNGW
jgi:hypothetical protein